MMQGGMFMIKMFRIDERLIHGQIVIKWSRHTSVDRIVVANDAAAGNSIVQKSLKMAAPPEIKTAIKTVDEAIELLNDPRSEPLQILLLVNSPKDALTIVKNVKGIPFINVGNYGRVAPETPGMTRKTFASNLYCNEEEVDQMKELIATGLKCNYQTTPEQPAENLETVLKIK